MPDKLTREDNAISIMFSVFFVKELILAKQCYGRTELKTILDARILQKIPSVFGSLELLRHGAAMKYERAV